jgi:hypothetical protein
MWFYIVWAFLVWLVWKILRVAGRADRRRMMATCKHCVCLKKGLPCCNCAARI